MLYEVKGREGRKKEKEDNIREWKKKEKNKEREGGKTGGGKAVRKKRNISCKVDIKG